MPTFPGSDDAIGAARKYLGERLNVPSRRRDSNVSIVSTITQLGKYTV